MMATVPTFPITVYSFRRCPFAMRVRITLHEKQIPFETREEDLKNFSADLRRLHPEAKVPVLVHGSTVVYESAVITEYLEDRFPELVRLMPDSAFERAEVRLWTHWCNLHFKPDVDRFKYGVSRFTQEECAGVENRLELHFEKIRNRLATHPWLVGDKFSLADIHVFPFVRQFVRITPEPKLLSNNGVVRDWVTRISSRESFRKTMQTTVATTR